jgi:hypothetical protein
MPKYSQTSLAFAKRWPVMRPLLVSTVSKDLIEAADDSSETHSPRAMAAKPRILKLSLEEKVNDSRNVECKERNKVVLESSWNQGEHCGSIHGSVVAILI